MALTPEQERQVRHLVAHAARILLTLASHPDLPNRAEYDAQMDIYRARWGTVPAEDRARVPAELIVHPELGDLTHDAVVGALAALTAHTKDQIIAATASPMESLETIASSAIAAAVAEDASVAESKAARNRAVRDALVDASGQFTPAALPVVANLTAAFAALGA